IGSVIVAITGYSMAILIQTAYLYASQLANVQTTDFVSLILLFVSACTNLLLSLLLFRFGYGFSFSLNHFKVKRENLLILVIAVTAFILVTFLHLLKNKLYFVEMIAAAIVLFLIYIALKRERTQW